MGSKLKALLIRQKGEEAGIDFLKSGIDKAASERLRAILVALTTPPRNDLVVTSKLISFLEDERSLIVMEAIDGLRMQNAKEVTHLVFPLLAHTSPYVRSGVLRFMAHFYPEQTFPVLLHALKDDHFIVRETAVDALDELGKVEAIPYLQPLVTDAHPHVQQAAQTAIKNLESLG